ncbi:MAG: MarR family transcriptional regulator [Sphingopyxis sp.]|nr:MarR family transcriptional regulator [Sphingopyxis sp.]
MYRIADQNEAAAGMPERVTEPLVLLLAGGEPTMPDFGGADVRVAGHAPLAMISERLAQQGRLDILWLCGAEAVTSADAERLRAELARLDARLVCEADGAALAAAFAEFAHVPGAQFLANPDPVERALALAAAQVRQDMRVADSGRGEALERIDRLQDEVARISALLAALTDRSADFLPRAIDVPGSGPVSFSPAVRDPARSYRPEPEMGAFTRYGLAEGASAPVRRVLRQRRMREQFFPADLFADPAWDMLLDLYAAQLEGQPVAVSSLCIAAAVPATTALRWIKTMTDTGMFERRADPRDGRRIFIGLAPPAAQAMERYFAALETVR